MVVEDSTFENNNSVAFVVDSSIGATFNYVIVRHCLFRNNILGLASLPVDYYDYNTVDSSDLTTTAISSRQQSQDVIIKRMFACENCIGDNKSGTVQQLKYHMFDNRFCVDQPVTTTNSNTASSTEVCNGAVQSNSVAMKCIAPKDEPLLVDDSYIDNDANGNDANDA